MTAALVLPAGCACGGPRGPAPAPAEQQAPEGTLPELEHTEVTLFFPAQDGMVLVPEKRQIVKTAEPVAMAQQVVAELIAGPPQAGGVRALPETTVLRQICSVCSGWIVRTSTRQSSVREVVPSRSG